MKFSILLPSRNRAEYLDHAVASVLMQGHQDFEIIVSDNASEPSYESFVHRINDSRVRYYRQDSSLPVTESWNAALKQATGEYLIMLGDDDALTPGLLAKLDQWAVKYRYPDIIYVGSYHYCYPNVLPGNPAGFFADVRNSVFFEERSVPFVLRSEEARRVALAILNFRHLFGFNAQHFIVRRSFVDELGYLGDYYQSPYPDFYAAAIAFLKARSIVVVPQPLAIIGISPKSFGFFFFNKREGEGVQFLRNDEALEHSLGRYAGAILPGSRHNTNWLAAVATVERRLESEMPLAVNLRRYRRLQIVSTIERYCVDKALRREEYQAFLAMLNEAERRLADNIERAARIYLRALPADPNNTRNLLHRLLNQHFPPKVETMDIGAHKSILDAYNWLQQRELGHESPANGEAKSACA